MAVYNYLPLTGVIVPDTSLIQTQVEQEFKNVFGEDLDVSPQTTQGVLIAMEVEARSTLVNNNAALANQINPNLAGGVYLDASMALTGYERSKEEFSQVLCNLAGVPGTVIPEGVTTQNIDGVLFASNGEVTLASNGTASIYFTALIPGPIAAAMGTITQIVQGVPGWETVINPSAAILGRTTQSDQGARADRRNTLGIQGNGQGVNITSRLYGTPGVTSVSYRENDSNVVTVIDGVSMLPHSMFACVAGGSDFEVATTIASVKGGGCDYTNSAGTPVNVTLTMPWGQTFVVKFSRPILKNISVQVTVSQGTSTADPTESVKAAILAYAAGKINNEAGFGIGDPVSCWELAGAVASQVPGIFVHLLETKLSGDPDFSTDEIPIAVFEQAVTNENLIAVVLA